MWSIVPSPNALSPLMEQQYNALRSVTCNSATDCWAVGYFADGAVYSVSHTLIERWNGSGWSIVPSPDGDHYNELNDAACASSSDCWAVGYSQSETGAGSRTLIERWNGSAWSVVPSPNNSTHNRLNGVTCASASDCWAVGYFSDLEHVNALIEKWNGTAWSIVTSLPNPLDIILHDVTCASASNCWAVGLKYAGDERQTLIVRWDGTAWSIVTSPNGSTYDELNGVTCTSPSDCWAVGNGFLETLIEKYTAPIQPVNVVSRKVHGGAGTFDINLPFSGAPGIECRSGGAAGNYRIIVTFPNAVTCNNSKVTGGTGSVSSFSVNASGTKVTVNLTGVANAQTITVTLIGVNDGINTGDVAVRMAVLLGDTTANRAVNSSDIAQTKSKSGQTVTSVNFRQDVTINGVINSSDIALVKSKSGTGIP